MGEHMGQLHGFVHYMEKEQNVLYLPRVLQWD